MPATDPLHQVFCANVRARRKELGLTQAEVAERLGIKQPSYFEIETGRTTPTLTVVSRVAEVLDISATDLLTETIVEKSFR